jgi:2-amino-4-hydroxy-6-hydroxymethyldihydropteridine diphosphokinase/dihydropteroate synthase
VRVSDWTQHNVSKFKPFPATPAELPEIPNIPEKAYIALGSNLGDRIDWIEQACSEMERQGIKILRTSCLWETDPMYVLEQDKFVNGVCEVSSNLLK